MKFLNFIIDRIKSFVPAFQGILFIIKNEKNTWIHLLASIVAVFLIFLLKLNYIESLFFLSAIFLVWIAEIFNSAIEYTLDFIHPANDSKIKIIKDISAAGVLLSAVYAVIVAIIIIISKISTSTS
ncbi:MAG: diacylglycerol kinase family protein [Anaerolineaceae bacterium]|nr:diacylglycerol kinase family protein [Anaerolineaceae bacterium]